MNNQDCIVGMDLGTTNSEIAAFVEGRVVILGQSPSKMLPSCVGLLPTGELLVGQAARHQQLIYPERTVRSIKRKMGSNEKVLLGEKEFTPQDISSLILKKLVEWAQEVFKHPVTKAVITVPAYFSDAQRNATREAGALAGLEVVRILNEPTAASLAYGFNDDDKHTVMVYDLGGGTFDVSIVTMEGGVTEVLASHGNTQLGGDDFNQLLVDFLLQEFHKAYGIDLSKGYPVAFSRLWWAAEETKKKLSYEPYVQLREESLITIERKPLHLDIELSRERYEDMIRPLVESTLESVYRALEDARKTLHDLDTILLVGGATRTPLVYRTLEEKSGITARQDVNPDLCVALGAGVLASRLAGHDVDKILVDISPYSFGPSYLGERGGVPYPYCYRPIITRNTPLPVTRTERYFTSHSYQDEVEINIYQGEDSDALRNILVGSFRVRDLTPKAEPNEVLIRMNLDLDGILRVTAIEKMTGKSKQITINNALQEKSPAEIEENRRRLEALFSARATEADLALEADEEGDEDWDLEKGEDFVNRENPEGGDEKAQTDGMKTGDTKTPLTSALVSFIEEAESLMNRSRSLLDQMHPEDKEEAIDLHEMIKVSIEKQDRESLLESIKELKELLFFIEGKQ